MLELLASVFLVNDSPMKRMQFNITSQRRWSGGEAGGWQGVLPPLFPHRKGFPTTGNSEQVEQQDSILMRGWITHGQFTDIGCTQEEGAVGRSWCCSGGPTPGYGSSVQRLDDGPYFRLLVSSIHHLIVTA